MLCVGGAVDGGETFQMAGKREVLEEAGVRVVLKGIIRIEHTVRISFASLLDNCRSVSRQ
jgi:8-oxo-dGTP pyrophosphatase MutT (NUDIX family)